jgi:septal ring factor EnvC (AmiA/AmiB activator)
MDLNADLASMDLAQLVEYQQELTRYRKAVLATQANVQAELDARRRRIAAQRAAEDQALGQQTKPPAQELLAGAPEGS